MKKCTLPAFDPFEKIGGDWALLSAVSENEKNAMTVSWGECGVLWNKKVFTVFVRPERHTHHIIEESGIVTLSFFDKSFRNTLTYFGRTSGRDEDKIEKSGLASSVVDGALVFDQSELALVGRVIYKSELKEENFLNKSLLSNYRDGGFHTVYTCEIIDCFSK